MSTTTASAGPYETLLCEERDGIVTVTLNRPDRMNVMNITMREELATCFERLRADSGVRVVVVTGAGDAFCAGGDANDFRGASPAELHELMRRKSHRWFQAMWSMPQPVIAAVNGTAAGGGANLALAADMVIASDRARFGETFVRLGLMPDLGGAFLLPRIVGLHRAKELSFTGAVLDAQEAMALGLFNRVVPHERLLEEAAEVATDLARRPAVTLAAIKSMMNRSFESSMEEVLQQELFAQSFLFATPEHADALDGFFDGDQPSSS